MEARLEQPVCDFSCRVRGIKNLFGKVGWGVGLTIIFLAALFVASPPLATQTVLETSKSLWQLSPFLLASFAIAAYTRAASVENLLTRVFMGNPHSMILGAALVATLSPLCSCTVVAIIAVLLRAGIPLSAVMAFWVGSPVISPDLFIYTWGVLGHEIAVMRFVAAVVMSLLAGWGTMLLERSGAFTSPLRGNLGRQSMSLDHAQDPAWTFWKSLERREIFVREFKLAFHAVLPWMVLAFTVESLVTISMPRDMLKDLVGSSNVLSIPLAVLISIPTYINGVAAVPIVEGFMKLGMNAPAALAYLTAGSIMTVPAMLAVFPLVRFRVFLWHLAVGLAGAISVSYLYFVALT